ncbi:unnamed protein product [Ixodes pacificus]
MAGQFGEGGGGFMSTDFGFSQATPQRKESNRPDNVVPCTIAQIHRMGEGEDHMTVAGLEVQYVTVVGLVTHVDQQSTKVSYTVDDRTGPPLEGHIFATEPEEQARILSQLVEGTYVRVVGSVRSVDGRRMLKTFRAFGLTDLNELTMHLAEVIHTHMALLVDSKKAPAEDRVDGGGMVKPEPMDTSTFGGGVANNSLGLEPKQNMVYELIRECRTPIGISLDEVCAKVKSLSRAAIKDVVEFLSNEGHIYTTMDDCHYKATDGF